MAKVNLDALILREDFMLKEEETAPPPELPQIGVTNILPGEPWLQTLRKPDFQRETSEWDATKVVEFIRSFLVDDLIPPVIMWHSKAGLNFAIDGSHRLSSLIAWVHDDYGDKELSQKFYGLSIPTDQVKIAKKVRLQIQNEIGSYSELKRLLNNPSAPNDEKLVMARKLATATLSLQWVRGNSEKAESSFFRINGSASKINPAELEILRSRKKPNSIAARAIKNAGAGHKYWSDFDQNKQTEVQNLAVKINDILFEPPLETPVKTLDIPIAGKKYSAQTLPLVRDFINLSNKIITDEKKAMVNDTEGIETLRFLQQCEHVAKLINSNDSGSLGLHPAFYFYSYDGRHKPASLYGAVGWLLEMEENKSFNNFIDVRPEFEIAIVKYDYVVQQIVRRHRGALKSSPFVAKFYLALTDELKSGKKADEAVQAIAERKEFNLSLQKQTSVATPKKAFDTETKSGVFLKKAMSQALKCSICGGYIHRNSITTDHVVRKEDGGMGVIENGDVAHPYCNTTYKN